MRRWTLRLAWAFALCGAVPAVTRAGDAGDAPAFADCPFRAASPYNPTVIARPVPNPAWNMCNFTIPCDLPLNLDPYVFTPNCWWGGGCGSIFGTCNGWGGSGGNCGCDHGCGAILGGRTGCGKAGGCGAMAPAPTSDSPAKGTLQQVNFIWPSAPNSAANSCNSCPPNGPPPRHVLPRPTSMGCANCSTVESETVFIFGSCRQFFGEPTWGWLHRRP